MSDYLRLSEVFKALSDDTRRSIIVMLRNGEEKTVTEIVERFGLAQPTISRHLAVLKQAGLVESRRDKQHVFYRGETQKTIDDVWEFIAALDPELIMDVRSPT